MAEGNQCRAVRLFGGDWDYQCPNTPAVPLKSPSAPAPVAAKPKVKAAEEQQSCRNVRSGGDYFEICTPKATSSPASSLPTRSLWSVLGEWLKDAFSHQPQQRAMFRR